MREDVGCLAQGWNDGGAEYLVLYRICVYWAFGFNPLFQNFEQLMIP